MSEKSCGKTAARRQEKRKREGEECKHGTLAAGTYNEELGERGEDVV